MGWNYRVMRHENESGVAYDIHEVYYEKDGSVKNWTENGVSPMADTRDGIFLVLANMADAIGQPVLDGKTGEVVEEKRVAGESLTKALETVRDEMECSSAARLTRERDATAPPEPVE